MPTVAVTDATFQSHVLDSASPVVVNFWARWCGPCRRLAPVLEQIADEHSEDFTVVKVEIDENPATAGTYKVMAVPTTVLFVNRREVARVTGALPKGALLDALLEPYRRDGDCQQSTL
ncbi:thioredoxin [Nocardia cyriacigeorgica]|uniref:Thioredoxin n=1 Tax=Nocardia cyriacigeorgica TaxID=135487 RepID=A0A4U8VYC4_9NOCA|nr:thioredoxin [Nocardia cyriacigeorgica]MBF6101171.1 thioredoxin [Nocardia cyriacigeorgica]MBF6160584.1 thioredoxin [Nocardia cyriacigeorgica]MBF6199649.1 thioredoxin [Nocardia cyriacigeorgica]MBF6320051.1 thioredoxin [Nocardia cyriacigeorgica]MBF6347386.1 thioredoxin [Nocardia cyriacigeorgica]